MKRLSASAVTGLRASAALDALATLLVWLSISDISTAAITYDAALQAWTLKTADVRYVLRRDRGLVVLQYFGAAEGWKDDEDRRYAQFTGGTRVARPELAGLTIRRTRPRARLSPGWRLRNCR